MTAVDPFLAARVAELGVPLSADWAPSKPLPGYLAAIGQAGSEYEQALYAAYQQAMAEAERLRSELDEAVRVSETLNRRLQDEMLAGSALYAALTMPTEPEQLQAALTKFRTVARKVTTARREATA
jgi:hypothetical protein